MHQWLVGLGVWFSLWVREVPGSNPGRAHSFWNNFDEKSDEKKSYAVTRIRTWVVAATTRSTNHYTITALDELLFWQKNKNQGGVKNWKKIPPRRGIEPRSLAWQARILTTILPRMMPSLWFFVKVLLKWNGAMHIWEKKCSRAGNRTPAAAVRAPNPNH